MKTLWTLLMIVQPIHIATAFLLPRYMYVFHVHYPPSASYRRLKNCSGFCNVFSCLPLLVVHQGASLHCPDLKAHRICCSMYAREQHVEQVHSVCEFSVQESALGEKNIYFFPLQSFSTLLCAEINAVPSHTESIFLIILRHDHIMKSKHCVILKWKWENSYEQMSVQ